MSISSFRLPNNTKTAAARAKKLFESIQDRFQHQELRSHEDVRSAVYEAFQDAFTHAGEPTFEGGALPKDIPRLLEHYIPLINKIADDLYVAYKESQAIAQTNTSLFNFQKTTMDMLDGQAKRAGSTLIDVQITNDRFLGPVIVAGDDFNDTSRIDTEAALGLPKADVNPLAGVLTLQRTKNKSVINIDNVSIVVEPLQSYKQKLYEGQFYGLVGQATPEAGQFRFVERKPGDAKKETIPADLFRRYLQYQNEAEANAAGRANTQTQENIGKAVSPLEAVALAKQDGVYGGLTAEEWELLGSQLFLGGEPTLFVPGEPEEIKSGVSANKVLVDEGAPPQLRLEARKAMLDGNPDTFWQVEYSIPADPVQALGSNNAKFFEQIQQNNPSSAQLIANLESLVNQSQLNFDTLDLDVRITINLGTTDAVNWVDLAPMLFEGIEHLKVLGIRSSEDGVNYTEIPTLQNGAESRISRSANQEVTKDIAESTLAPSVSAFAGQGLWAFAPRTMRYLQIDIRQPVPVITPYQTLKVRLSRMVHRRHSSNAIGKRRRGKTVKHTRTLELSYPETIIATGGERDLANVAGARGLTETGGGQRTPSKTLFPASAIGGSTVLRAAGVSLLAEKLGGFQKGTTTYGNETIEKQWFETKWDKARYAIGIRDIGVWQYEFAESSEFISIPFKSPAPIRSISLEVDENIPSEFNEGQRIQSWIDYYVSVGEAENWQQLAPVSNRTVRNLESGQVPGVIHVNSGVPVSERNPGEAYIDLDHKVDTVKFRAVLRRPAGTISATPSLSAYRLLLTTGTGSF